MSATTRTAARAAVEEAASGLIDLSHRIHSHPELGYEEERACAWVGEALAGAGFRVEEAAGGVPTALVGTAGSGPLVVGICAEYDALPSIGHACGHNVIAAAAVGAGMALSRVADDAGITVRVIGTPAEEAGGGKIVLLERGVFDGCHLSMMVHPSPYEQSSMECLAVSHLGIHMTGKEAHASAFPQDGINAADALTIAQVAIGLLRQHIHDEDRIHGIVTVGGAAPNIVPAHADGRWYVRAHTLERLAQLEPRVRRCFEAGALATGATLEINSESAPYSEMITDPWLESAWRRNAEELGREFPEYPEEIKRQRGSTDMANISLALPVIHPMLGIESLPASNHQPAFTAACVREPADRAVLQGAIGMAWTVLDAASDPAQRERFLAGPARAPSEVGREHLALAGAPSRP